MKPNKNLPRVTPKVVTELPPDHIFVFGSNMAGIHGAGAALAAKEQFGAMTGVGFGICGRTYAIPTKSANIKRALTIAEIKPYVKQFFSFVRRNPYLTFLVTPVGTGLAGISVEEIAPLFKEGLNLENVYLPESFIKVLKSK